MTITPEQAERLYNYTKDALDGDSMLSSVVRGCMEGIIQEIEEANKPLEIWVCDYCSLVIHESPQNRPPAMNNYCSRGAAMHELGKGLGAFHQFRTFVEKK